jgi:hypothetical protein
MTTLSVVIPAYNEEGGIRSIMERVLAVRDALREVGVASWNCWWSMTARAIARLSWCARNPAPRLVQHAKNGGYGAALKTGFRRRR